jgi:hypothetical protein
VKVQTGNPFGKKISSLCYARRIAFKSRLAETRCIWRQNPKTAFEQSWDLEAPGAAIGAQPMQQHDRFSGLVGVDKM